LVPGPAEFVDAHAHFWDQQVRGLSWAWLEPGFTHPRLGRLVELAAPRFAIAEYRTQTQHSPPGKVVHVQSAKTADPVIETSWLQQLSDVAGWPDAIVGYCDYGAADLAEVVERHLTHRAFRGVRDLPAGMRLDDPAVVRGIAALATFDISIEVMTSHEHFDQLLALARQHVATTIVLGHAGLPVARDDDYRRAWSAGLDKLATAPNIVCKVSALGGADPSWTTASLRPWVLGCLDAFGPDRCMFASNWPVDSLFSTYDDLVAAYVEITQELATHERRAFFQGTAERVYRI
jgi:predicted TIM-barrel fold metal-dependent hydrolase